MSRHLLVSLALILILTSTAPTAAQPADSVAADSAAIVDSLQAALDRFEVAEPPPAVDSAALRRWADSAQAEGRSLWRRHPTQARRHHQQARRAYRALSDSVGIAEAISNVGVTHYLQSRYEEAVRRYETALAMHRALGNRSGIAATLNNMGLARDIQGRYQDALARYQTSLHIERDLGNRKGVARTLNNIGLILKRQGQYGKALARYQESLQLYRDLGEREGMATTLNNVGNVYREQGKHEEALARFQASLRIKRQIGDQEGIANTLSNIGSIRRSQGRYEQAHRRYQEALQIKREIGDRRGIAISQSNVGHVRQSQGQYEQALSHFRTSLRIRRQIGEQKGRASSLHSIGSVHLQDGRRQAALDTLRQAVRLAERLRGDATSPEARRSLLSTQIGAYRTLATAYVRSAQPDSAFRSVEQARARLLADRLAGPAGDTTFTIPSAPALHRTLGPDEAALLYAGAGSEWPLTALVVTRDTTVARELPDSTVRAAIENEYPTRLTRLRREEGPLTAALSENRSSAQDTTPSLAEVVRLYRYYLTREQADTTIQTGLSQRLHGLLVDPLTSALAETTELTVVPTGALGFLPFETLQDASGTYLAEQEHVRYAQSLTVLRQLQQRTYSEWKRPLLAVGGAAYGAGQTTVPDAVTAEARRGTTQVATAEHASTLLRSAERRLEQGRSPKQTYTQLGYAGWVDLPGTQEEVDALRSIAGPAATALTGSDASEVAVRRQQESGRLSDYRYLHFATHGVAVPESPELSALVLSQVGASDSLAAKDGYLTMEEIADLEMQADVAVLSACQTGLGKVVAGEGVVSLSHAFLRAGANATLVSQWKVLDKSTRQFMTAVYKRAKKEDTSFAEAVTETKRAFIGGKYGEKNTDPLRWAPFVYYGRE